MQGLEAFGDGDMPLSVTSQYSNSTKSRVIYQTIILAVVTAIASLPFIEIPVSVKGSGVIQSEAERIDLFIPVNGKILKVFISDNQKVAAGDTLLSLDASLPDHRIKLLKDRITLLQNLLEDICRSLARLNQPRPENTDGHYETQQYAASWNQFLQELSAKRNRESQRERDFVRYSYLYKSNVVTASEFEKYKLEYDDAASEYMMLERQYKLRLQEEAATYQDDLKEIEGELIVAQEQRKLFTVVSPAPGSIQNLKSPGADSYGFANQKIAEISPDGRLWAFCFVDVKDIGMIRAGQAVNYQLDPYNHHRWGTVSGKVEEVFDDVTLVNNMPTFKIRCSLNTDHLDLNGFKAYIKKGMSFTARFNTGKHTLLTLLWGKAHEIVDPNLEKRS